jgi:hypothetical protein
MKRFRLQLVMGLFTLLVSSPALAQTFWFDDFNADTSDAYEVLLFTTGRDQVEFNVDYSQLGIPEAPSSLEGGTRGVQFFVNNPFEDSLPATTGVQIAPRDLGDVLSGNDFTLTYDLWMNVNGPLPAGGAGSTEAMMVGVGFSGFTPIEAGNIDGTYFTLTGEAGSLTDVRSFTNEGFNAFNEDGSPINVTANDAVTNPLGLDSNPYYHAIFPGGVDVGTLPVQGGQDNQVGVTNPGQMAFMWHEVRVDVRGNEVSFYVNDLLISQDKDAIVEGTIFVGYADYFASVTDAPQWSFSLVDNLRVFMPASGDFNGNGALDADDIDLLTTEVNAGDNDPAFDLDGDGLVTQMDRDVWVNDLRGTYYGDSDLDGEFNSSDFVFVFQAGQYEDSEPGNSTWATGDWNGDTEFDSSDFVTAFQAGGFEQGPRAAVSSVPEPTSSLLGFLALAGMIPLRRGLRAVQSR